jgi:hypothetical protein
LAAAGITGALGKTAAGVGVGNSIGGGLLG